MSRAEDTPFGRRLLALEDGLRVLWGLTLFAVWVAPAMLLPEVSSRALDVVLRVLVTLAGQLVVLSLLRQLLPSPPIGSFRLDEREHFITVLSTTLAEVAMWTFFRWPFWLLRVTRVVYLRALGAEVAMTARLPSDFFVRDPALLRIGRAARIEPGVRLETLSRHAGRVRAARVWIGRKAVVGAGAMLAPGASLAHEAQLGPGVLVGEDARVGLGASIAAHAVLGANVEVGAYVIVGVSAVVGEGARLADRSRVVAGSVVPDDAQVGEREIYPSGASWSRRSSLVSLRVVDG